MTDVKHMLNLISGNIEEVIRLSSDDIEANQQNCLSKLDVSIRNLDNIRHLICSDQYRSIAQSVDQLRESLRSDVIADSSHDGRTDIAYRVPRLLSGKWGMAYLSKITVDSKGRLKMREWKMRYGQKCKGGKCRSGKCESR